MSLRIRFQFATGAALAYSVERLSDGLLLDFVDGVFRATPATLLASLPEGTGSFLGQYKATLATVSSVQWADGNFAVAIHNTASANLTVGLLGVTMHAQDDQPYYGAATDPWATTASGYAGGSFGAIFTANLNATVSSRSTFAGGSVQLAANGLDLVLVESINARQALVEIAAACCGNLTGAGTGAIVIRGAGSATTRITSTTDSAGNRSGTVLNPPA